MPLRILGCSNVKVYGLTLRDSGGDGIYVARGATQAHCKDIYLKDLVCDNHYRQGISVISADGLLVENCVFQNTWGTPPCAGVDLEPDVATEMLRRIVFRNCLFKDNLGDGIQVWPPHLRAESGEISILFDECRVTSKWGSGIRVGKLGDQVPGGVVEFRDCTVENTAGYGIRIRDKSADRARVRFINCTVRNTATDRAYRGPWAPVYVSLEVLKQTKKMGGIDFINCLVEDDKDRPAVLIEGEIQNLGLFDVTGDITVRNPYGLKYTPPEKQTDVTLVVKQSEW